MTDKKQTEELNEAELDQVTGGAGSKGLLAHELTHVQQQGGSKYIGETEKNLGISKVGKRGTKSVAATGGGSGI